MDDLNLLKYIELLENFEARRARKVNKRPNFFLEYDDIDFHRRFRLTKESVWEIHRILRVKLEPPTYKNNALSPLEQILVALRYYATGTFQVVLGDLGRISQSTVSRVVHRVSQHLAAMNREFITFPKTEEECSEVAKGFFKIAQFPGTIGTLDCSHVRITSPGGVDGERFRCRKGFFSINVQTVVSSDLIIENVVARWPGSAHDSTIFNNSAVAGMFHDSRILQRYHILGDSGYANQDCLLTPFLNPSSIPQGRYNKSHVLTRNTVERKYGVLKNRFPCLRIGINCHIENVPAIIVACCVLHNLAVKIGDPEPPEDPEVVHLIQTLATGRNARYSSSGNRQAYGGAGTAAGEARRTTIVDEYFT